MSGFASWIGGALGWTLGGPIGAAIGFAIGTAVDKATSKGLLLEPPKRGKEQRRKRADPVYEKKKGEFQLHKSKHKPNLEILK